MLCFQSDYLEGCHPLILEKLSRTNLEQTPGYSTDNHCENAAALTRKLCNAPDADVHFLVGGTQTNLTVISSILRPYQGVLCATQGHINVHETGAIEACGHKVLALPSADGKITAEQIEAYCIRHYSDPSSEHIVQPGMVYISFPTEGGLLYTKSELEEINAVCHKRVLPLFIDGARMGYGLGSPKNALTLPEIASLCDVFYIGGTKCGALFGEALVIMKDSLKKDFRYIIKQKGGMLAKGRLLGIQFETLFDGGLYFDICKEAVSKALKIREAFLKKGIKMNCDSFTNQQFPILTKKQISFFENKYQFELWEPYGDSDDLYVTRFCTSWATTDQAVKELVESIEAI